MNILAQCCGLLIIGILLFVYLRQKKLGLVTEKVFLTTMLSALSCICLDILSIVGIRYDNVLPSFLVVAVCKLYLMSLVMVSVCGSIYIGTEMAEGKDGVNVQKVLVLSLAVLSVILILILPTYYFEDMDTNVVYSYGPSIYYTYAVELFLMIFMVGQIIYAGKRINQRRREAVLIWLGVWILSAVIQFLNNEMLVVGFACAVGMLVLYIKLENPEMNFDRKTGLYNMNAFQMYMKHLFFSKQHFVIVMLTIDKADYRNADMESLDLVKQEAVDCLARIPKCKVFSSSEDEFILVFQKDTEATKSSEALRERFAQGFGKNRNIYLRFSLVYMPAVHLVEGPEDVTHLIHYTRRHNRDMSNTKMSVVDKDMVAVMYQEMDMIRTVVDAIEHDRIEVYYQPIYSTQENCFVSAEALVRIRDAQGRLIMPGAFIETAERNGLIVHLGRIVFEKVCRFLSENNLDKLGVRYIEVNLSVIQCAYPDLADEYIEVMKKYYINPEWINLEITESASVEAKKTLLRNMKKLIKFGVSFSLDDFGTGQSNLNYIVDMPVSIIKFDREMTIAYFENRKAKYVVDAAMHMVHGMNLKIVSEGIETQQQFEVMKGLGISYIQGYYFSKPLPPAEFLDFISAGNEAGNESNRCAGASI